MESDLAAPADLGELHEHLLERQKWQFIGNEAGALVVDHPHACMDILLKTINQRTFKDVLRSL